MERKTHVCRRENDAVSSHLDALIALRRLRKKSRKMTDHGMQIYNP